MIIKIAIATDNAAFDEDHLEREIADMLHSLAEGIRQYPRIAPGLDQPIIDLNGNTVGRITIVEAKE